MRYRNIPGTRLFKNEYGDDSILYVENGVEYIATVYDIEYEIEEAVKFYQEEYGETREIPEDWIVDCIKCYNI